MKKLSPEDPPPKRRLGEGGGGCAGDQKKTLKEIPSKGRKIDHYTKKKKPFLKKRTL